MFSIKSIEEIRHDVIAKNSQIINFSKVITFPFNELYKEIVTKIKTINISSECILYNSVKATNITKEYSDIDYWNKNTSIDSIKNYWFIGQNGQGDYWIMDINNKIYFYNHDDEEINIENLIDLNMDFEKWLKFAYLNKELDKIYDENEYDKNTGIKYMEKLKEISQGLYEKYPFRMELE